MPVRAFTYYFCEKLDGAGDLTGTQTTGAGIYSLGGTVHNSLNALDVRLPSAVGTTMRVRNLNSESYALTADITFCHDSAPPLLIIIMQHEIF